MRGGAPRKGLWVAVTGRSDRICGLPFIQERCLQRQEKQGEKPSQGSRTCFSLLIKQNQLRNQQSPDGMKECGRDDGSSCL